LNTGLNCGLEFIVDYQIFPWWKVNLSLNVYKSKIEATELLDNQSTEATLSNGKISSFMTLPKDWTVQLSGQYNAPWLDLQTEMMANYWLDLAVKKDILNRRATVNLRVSDMLCTGGWGHDTHNDQLNRVVRSKRLSPYVTIGFSYKINNGLRMNKKNIDAMNMDDMESGGEY
jgi:hypothetical protein